MKTAGILFDYNGVLVADEHLQKEAMARVLARFGLELTPALYEEKCLGRPDKESFENLQAIFPALGSQDINELVQKKVAEYQKLIEEKTIIYSGVKRLLEELHQEFLLAVVTGSLRVEVEPVLDKAGVMPLFEAIITADDITRGKPDPEGYLKGVAALGLPKEKIVVIEDTPSGLRAAQAAGLKCIAVPHTVERDQLAAADRIVENIEKITPGLIREVLNEKR